jgi:hypothetical protein
LCAFMRSVFRPFAPTRLRRFAPRCVEMRRRISQNEAIEPRGNLKNAVFSRLRWVRLASLWRFRQQSNPSLLPSLHACLVPLPIGNGEVLRPGHWQCGNSMESSRPGLQDCRQPAEARGDCRGQQVLGIRVTGRRAVLGVLRVVLRSDPTLPPLMPAAALTGPPARACPALKNHTSQKTPAPIPNAGGSRIKCKTPA